jgi:hypothetical protein
MAKNLARILDSDMPRLPLRKAAEQLRKKGRGRDTVLAHITPREAARLKAEGGSGTINPYTGLPEFDDGFDASAGADWSAVFSQPTYDYTPAPMADTFQPSATGSTGGLSPQELASGAASLQADYNAQVGNQNVSGVTPGQELWSNYYNIPLSNYQANLTTPATGQDVGLNVDPYAGRPTDAQFAAYNQPAGGNPTVADMNRFLANTTTPPGQTPAGEYQLTPEQQRAVDEELGGNAIDLTTKTPATSGFQTPFGNLGTKELIAALGLGGLGLNYLSSQNQAKKSSAALQQAYQNAQNQIQPAYAQAAQSIPAAYTQASQDLKNLVAPMQQQASTLYGQSLTGSLAPAYQQQLAAAQAQAAQSYASSGGVGAAQAERSIEDTRQRLLASQQQYANSLFGVVNPTMASAIQQQLAGQVAGVQTGLQGITTGAQLGLQGTTSAQAMNLSMSQQSGTAATGMLTALAALYGGRAA